MSASTFPLRHLEQRHFTNLLHRPSYGLGLQPLAWRELSNQGSSASCRGLKIFSSKLKGENSPYPGAYDR